MTQRFNAPPGWNVPPDFVPTADWKPDPSWPAAPEGWTYWVDDAAPAGQPADQGGFGTASAPQYGTPAASYGSASQPQAGIPYGQPTSPAGAYGSAAPGSAQVAMAQAQQANARKSTLIGFGLFVLSIVITVVSYALAEPGGRYWAPWYLGLVGLILGIKGLVDMGKAKKAVAAAAGPYGAYGAGSPQGITPPGQNPPGTF